MSEPNPPLPPGETGLPLLGETLAFLDDGYRFLEERLARHGPIFRTHVLGRSTVVLAGQEAKETWSNPDLVQRAGCMPWRVERLLGSRSLPLLDGAAPAGDMATLLPAMQAQIEEALDVWADNGVLPLIEELKALALTLSFTALCPLERGAELEDLCRDYTRVVEGIGAVPFDLPGTVFWQAVRARHRIQAVLRRRIAEHREESCSEGRSFEAAGLDAEEAFHAGIAGFVRFALFAELVLRIVGRPDIRARLTAEAAGAPRQLTARELVEMPYTRQTVLEAMRTTRILPGFFGRARRAFILHGHTVPRGCRLLWAVRAGQMDPSLYPDPQRFEPERQGTGHSAWHPGATAATMAASLFTALLVRNYTVELPAQDLTLDFTRMPPVPRSGLRVRVMRKLTLAGATAAA